MAKNKKPTMMEVKNVINKLIYEAQSLRTGLNQVDIILNSYIRMNGDEAKVEKFLKEELAKKRQEHSIDKEVK